MGIILLVLSPFTPVQAQDLFQPALSSDVVVSSNVGPTGTGLDFDWADIPSASSYELAIRRGPSMIDNVVTTQSHGLYTSISNPLVPGDPGTPNIYSWQVVTYQNGQVINLSPENFFGLIRGTSVVFPATGVLEAPTNLQPDRRDLFTTNLVPSGLFMTWDPVDQAVGYEIQLVQIADAAGNPTNRLIYRQNVTSPMAVVSNIVTGGYRLDVRGIQSGGARGIPASTNFRIVPNYFDRNLDFMVNGIDMLALAKDWHAICRNLDSDFITDRIVDGNELMAMKIILEGLDADFPLPRSVPAPLPPLDVANLVEPVTNEPIVLASSDEVVLFDWDPVPDVEEWELTIRNVDLERFQDLDIFDPNQTQATIPASTFLVPLGGTGNYTWSVIAKGQCFTETETVRRPITIQVNFTLPKQETEESSEEESETEEAEPQTKDSSFKVGWLERVGGFFFGTRAEAVAPPKGATVENEVPVPQVIFPFEQQCVPLGPRFDLVWSEVPEADAYLVELRGRNRFGLVVYIPIPGAEYDSQTKLNRVVDTNPGDNIVQVKTQPTLEAVYTVRVAAIVDGVTGELSSRRVFSLSPACPIIPNFPYIDLDFNDDRTFDGKDLFAYAAAWYSATSEEKVDKRVDLIVDGFVDVQDLLRYRELFRLRVYLPKSPPLDAPDPQSPEPGSQVLFAQTQANGGVFFNWIPPATNEEAIPYIYEVQINRPDGISRVFSIINEFVFFPLTVDGTYAWRVRAISDDFTLGRWSSPFIFFQGIQRTVEGETPMLVSPADGEILPPGPTRLVWTNIEITRPDVCRFERVEIFNGDVFSATFDYFHRASMVDSPTVSVVLPIYPNFDRDFRWRVTTYSEFTDSNNKVFQFPGITSAMRSFRVEGNRLEVSGIGQWNGDNTRDGTVDFRDYARLEAGYVTTPDTSRSFNPERDLDYNGRVGHQDFLFTKEASVWPRRTLNNGTPPPIVAFPADLPGATPIVIASEDAGRGLTLSWTSTGSNRYFVEWLDSNYDYRAYYADRFPTPARLQPAPDQQFVFNSLSDIITFEWETIPDAQEYSLNIQTVDPLTGTSITVEPIDPRSATTSYQMTAGTLGSILLRPANGLYRFTVIPEACGHFLEFDFGAFNQFSVQFPPKAFEGETPIYGASVPKDLNLPTLFTPSTRIPATQLGLHYWRVTPVGDDLSFGTPTRWQRFGIGNLGPAFQ